MDKTLASPLINIDLYIKNKLSEISIRQEFDSQFRIDSLNKRLLFKYTLTKGTLCKITTNFIIMFHHPGLGGL
jgi:hypothetical protein